MRLRNIKNAREQLTAFEDLVLANPQANRGYWKNVFGNEQPIHLEIGMGKGKFILEKAISAPGINFLGIELSESIILKAARKLSKYQLNNLYLLNLDANNLDEVFGPEEIDKIYLNFSDPWPKTRHEKRRLTAANFINYYKELLSAEGEIEFKTDNQEFFEYSIVSFNNNSFKFLEINLNLHKGNENSIITTEYEDKFREKGNIIYYIKVKK
ncbi:MAG: tRNA (guanosine(46)-N7)-methyltransferase TrmB [Bacilli bacterium]|nr:tRNA (guanosine(46)-N7)-methyltransferase TrmB [Bacilli bacterium]